MCIWQFGFRVEPILVTASAPVKNVTRFKSGQKRFENNHMALLVTCETIYAPQKKNEENVCRNSECKRAFNSDTIHFNDKALPQIFSRFFFKKKKQFIMLQSLFFTQKFDIAKC